LAFRRGLTTNSPPQFGHTAFIWSVQAGQKVHSKLQMCASASGASSAAHFSHAVFISSDMIVLGFGEIDPDSNEFFSNLNA
jgi:hypothetical protein